MDEGFDLGGLLGERAGEGHRLQGRMLNPQLPKMLHAIGFDRTYTRAEGAYMYDENGQDYLDLLAGFGVFALGRNHPVVRSALHQVLDADLADLVQFDSPCWPACSPRSCSPARRTWTGSTSATAAPRRSRRR